MLPDLALLEIFDFYLDEDWWYTLVHVCRKWRDVVFGSPRRLDLRLFCTSSTPVREMQDIWPHLPIELWYDRHESLDMDNIFAALEHNDRICDLDLTYCEDNPGLEELLAALHRPFPKLTNLELWCGKSASVQPDSFLGGSAPLLETLEFNNVPFPGLPKLLLSTTHLVRLNLQEIPDSGYISPETMVTALSVSTSLEILEIEFRSPRGHPNQKSRCPPPQTRALLPLLTWLRFKGDDEYSEDLVARIDAPLLNKLAIVFFQVHQESFNTRQLTQFISRVLKFKIYDEARVVFRNWAVEVTLPQPSDGEIKLEIPCDGYHQLSSVAELCGSFFRHAPISAVERLYIIGYGILRLDWSDDIEINQWLDLFHTFNDTLKCLYISQEFVPDVAYILQEFVGEERVTELLPALETLFLEKTVVPVQKIIGQFVAARQLASHPIAISSWKREPSE